MTDSISDGKQSQGASVDEIDQPND